MHALTHARQVERPLRPAPAASARPAAASAPASLQRLVGNALAAQVLQRADTRESIRARNRPSAESTRARLREAQQLRQARNRSATVDLRRAEGMRLTSDRRLPARRAGSVRYPRIADWRRDYMAAFITHAMLGRGTAASVPISGMGPGYARGHLLARSLGGSGFDPRNLVPIAHAATNVTEMWHGVERPVRAHLLAAPRHRVSYVVRVDYPAGGSVVPSTLRFQVSCANELGVSCGALSGIRRGSIANAAV